MHRTNAITDADLERLGEFLSSDVVPAQAMDVATLEGWLTALIIGPSLVPPSAWLPWVWDFESGRDEVTFDNAEQATEILGIVMGLSNQIADVFQRDPATFESVFSHRITWGASEWCEGFLKATQTFDAGAWSALWAIDGLAAVGDPERSSLVTPFLRLGDQAGMEITDKEGDAQHWMDAVVPALVGVHAHWAKSRRPSAGARVVAPVRRTAPKVGRNDSCPCGSGKKFKHCCGAPQTLH
jgi:uncharacterized protein